MPTTSVVEQFDILEQVTSYVIYCIIIPSVNPLFLKCGEETLYAGIIIRATWSTHAARDPVLRQHLFIALAGVLCASFFCVTWHVFFLLFLPIWYHRKHWSLFHRTPISVLVQSDNKKSPGQTVRGNTSALLHGGKILCQSIANAYFSAAFACSVRAVNAAGSEMAISESIFRLRSMPAFLRPLMNVE